MKILSLTRFGRQGASSRQRSFQFSLFLQQSGVDIVYSPLFDDSLLIYKYNYGNYAKLSVINAYLNRIVVMMRKHRFDLVWIEKEALPFFPSWFEKWLLTDKVYLMDFDDAIFHQYDLHSLRLVRSLLGQRIDRLMAGARLVLAGNEYLADRARNAGAKWVEFLPTVVDFTRYDSCTTEVRKDFLRIVWIGSPSSMQYLFSLAPALAELNAIKPYVLRVIGGGELSLPGIQVECVAWSEDTEVELLKECHVGIMPLHDTPWEQGKCAYKLIQYMACGLPTVASAVGANCEVVLDEITGFLVTTEAQWVDRLGLLLDDAKLRGEMGNAGYERAALLYSLQMTAPRLAKLLRLAAGK